MGAILVNYIYIYIYILVYGELNVLLVRWIWADSYVINSRKDVECKYIRKRDHIPLKIAKYIETRLAETYQKSADLLVALEEINTLLDLCEKPTYAPIKADKIKLAQTLSHYKPAIQKKIRNLVFSLKR